MSWCHGLGERSLLGMQLARLLVLFVPSLAAADVDVSARGGYGVAGAVGDARVGYPVTGRLDAVLDLGVARGRWYPRGTPADDTTALDAQAGVRWTPIDRGVATLELSALFGGRRIGGDSALLAVGGVLGAQAVIRRRGVRITAGLDVPIFITEDGEVDRLDQQLHAGVELAIADATHLTASIFGGGAYGYDGDGTKFHAGALVGVRFAELERTHTSTARPSAFVATEYRLLGVAGHASHGLGYAIGATILDGHLRVGVAGFNRPGPINAKTFTTRTVNGEMHDGRSEFALRSDGNFVGLHVAPAVALGKLTLLVPITVGQAAFGFYLHGDDRAKVMGERVSTVENRLFGGTDSSFAFGVEGGVSASYEIATWISAFASVHYLQTVGYRALDRDNYAGVSGAAGIALTP